MQNISLTPDKELYSLIYGLPSMHLIYGQLKTVWCWCTCDDHRHQVISGRSFQRRSIVLVLTRTCNNQEKKNAKKWP